MFKFKVNANVKELIETKIIEHIDIDDFLAEKKIFRNVILCPTQAIDLVEKKINQNCINCGICWSKFPNYVLKSIHDQDYSIFSEFIQKNKTFVYKWLSLIIDNYSGIEIKSKGYSRVKRIPLLVKSKDNIYIIKCIKEIADMDSAKNEISDIIELIGNKLNKYTVRRVIIVVEEFSDGLNLDNDFNIMKLSDIYNKIIIQNLREIERVVV